ncbi:MAG: shikimate dehydrogenase [Steroidobacteraceae bacterium]
MDRYAVIGSGIAHSRSPQIHAMFAQATRQPMEYGLLDTPPVAFKATADAFFKAGGRGLNVTVPHKQAALQLCDSLTPRARRAGAVNTLARGDDGKLLGDNTDGAGLVRDLSFNLRCTLAGARVLLLGAGGAARGIIAPLVEAGVAALEIHNRHPARARALAQEFAELAPVSAGESAVRAPPAMPGVYGSTLRAPSADTAAAHRARRNDGGYDLIINATSASLENQLPEIPPHAAGIQTLAYDLAYRDRDTVFVHWARRAGAARAVMGLGMLVEQAAESFLLWRGVRPDTAHVLEVLANSGHGQSPA